MWCQNLLNSNVRAKFSKNSKRNNNEKNLRKTLASRRMLNAKQTIVNVWTNVHENSDLFTCTKEDFVFFAVFLRKMQRTLKGAACILYNNKYMIASIQINNTEIFALIAVLVFTLLSHKVLVINRKHYRNC